MSEEVIPTTGRGGDPVAEETAGVFRLLDGRPRMEQSRPAGCVTSEEFVRLLSQLGDVKRRRMVGRYTGAAALKWCDDYGCPVQERVPMVGGRERRWINIEAGVHWFFNVKQRKTHATRGGDRFGMPRSGPAVGTGAVSMPRTRSVSPGVLTGLPLIDAAAAYATEGGGGGAGDGVGGAVKSLRERMKTGEGVTTAEAGALLNLVKAEREQLELDEKRGKLLSAEDVRSEWGSMLLAYRSAMESMISAGATRIAAAVEVRVMQAVADAGRQGTRDGEGPEDVRLGGVGAMEAVRCEVEEVLRDEVEKVLSVLRTSADAEDERDAA